MKNSTDKQKHNSIRHSNTVTVNRSQYDSYIPASNSTGLSDLQQHTTEVLSAASKWGFNNSHLNVKRHKLDNHNWQLTVVNPKTRKTILQAIGHGDTVFANEDNLARMAETLMAQGLTIQTHFDD